MTDEGLTVNVPILDNGGKKMSAGFDVLFDYIPSISWYQMSVVLFGLYLRLPVGAIQFAAVVIQAEPGGTTAMSVKEREAIYYSD